MSDDSNNLDPWIDPELEARIVAMVLGEASDFEKAELERLAKDQPEVALFREKIEAVHKLAAETGQPLSDEWRMDPARRADLLEQLGLTAAATEKNPTEASDKKVSRFKIFSFQKVARTSLMIAAAAVAMLLPVVIISKSMTPSSAIHKISATSELKSELLSYEPLSADSEKHGNRNRRFSVEDRWKAQSQRAPSDAPKPEPESSTFDDLFGGRQIAQLGEKGASVHELEDKLAHIDTIELGTIVSSSQLANADGTETIFPRTPATPKLSELGSGWGDTPASPDRLLAANDEGLLIVENGHRQSALSDKENMQEAQQLDDYAYAVPNASGKNQDLQRDNRFSGSLHQAEAESKRGRYLGDVDSDWEMPVPERDRWEATAPDSTSATAMTEWFEDESVNDNGISSPIVDQDRPETHYFLSKANEKWDWAGLENDGAGLGGGAETESLYDDLEGASDFGILSGINLNGGTPRSTASGGDTFAEREAELDEIARESFDDAESNESKVKAVVEEGLVAMNQQKEEAESARNKMLDVAKRSGIEDIQRITGAGSKASDLETGKSTTLFRSILSESDAKAKIKEAETQWQLTGKRQDTGELSLSQRLSRRNRGEPASAAESLSKMPASKDSVKITAIQKEMVRMKAKLPAQSTEKHASTKPFSTFSLHVSDVSFKLAQAALLKNSERPSPESIRPEEFVNAFDYGDPAPSSSDKVSCALNQSAHPFLQQRNLLRVAMHTAATGRKASQPLHLTLLIDRSGSMEREDRQQSVLRAMELLTAQLGAEDSITVIGFARTPRLIAEGVTGADAKKLVKMIAATPSEGGTNLEEALKLAKQQALRRYHPNAQNRIVLLTDGAANLGDADPDRLHILVEGLRQKQIAFDACGVGADGLNDGILEALTRTGDGRYYFLDRPEDADAGFARQLAGALRPAAKDVKVQIRFNPKRVGHYRLIGFEKHRLKKEDFRNDSVAAAALAAAESGVALYQIEPLRDGSGEIGEVSIRFRDLSTRQMVERTFVIHFNPDTKRFDESAPALKLAGTAAFLAEKLRGGIHGDAVQLNELSPVLTDLRQHYHSDDRVRDLLQMIEKTKSLVP